MCVFLHFPLFLQLSALFPSFVFLLFFLCFHFSVKKKKKKKKTEGSVVNASHKKEEAAAERRKKKKKKKMGNTIRRFCGGGLTLESQVIYAYLLLPAQIQFPCIVPIHRSIIPSSISVCLCLCASITLCN